MRSFLALAIVVGIAGCGAPSSEEASLSTDAALSGEHDPGTPFITTTDLNLRAAPDTGAAILTVIPEGARIRAAARAPRDGFYEVTYEGERGWAHGRYLTLEDGDEPEARPSSASAGAISDRGRAQMSAALAYAERHNSGVSGGRCFEYVWRYLTSSGYGNLDSWYDAPDMASAYAKNFAEYFNVPANRERYALQRLPIDNPYDAPRGSVVVVAAGSPGTRHPIAGDISIAAGGGRFVNDGPYMGYGGSAAAFRNGGGRVLGVFVPR